ncbi:hypothetical protein BDR03DRAFT_1046484, partial [Suillus americanus]
PVHHSSSIRISQRPNQTGSEVHDESSKILLSHLHTHLIYRHISIFTLHLMYPNFKCHAPDGTAPLPRTALTWSRRDPDSLEGWKIERIFDQRPHGHSFQHLILYPPELLPRYLRGDSHQKLHLKWIQLWRKSPRFDRTNSVLQGFSSVSERIISPSISTCIA